MNDFLNKAAQIFDEKGVNVNVKIDTKFILLLGAVILGSVILANLITKSIFD